MHVEKMRTYPNVEVGDALKTNATYSGGWVMALRWANLPILYSGGRR